jgi:hypothetical protein
VAEPVRKFGPIIRAYSILTPIGRFQI